MKDVVSKDLATIDDLLDAYGASLDFPDEPEEVDLEPEDEQTRKENLEYMNQMAKTAGLGIKMRMG
jgi:hypothetical protein